MECLVLFLVVFENVSALNSVLLANALKTRAKTKMVIMVLVKEIENSLK